MRRCSQYKDICDLSRKSNFMREYFDSLDYLTLRYKYSCMEMLRGVVEDCQKMIDNIQRTVL